MTNSVDPDQTAPHQGLHFLSVLSVLMLRFFIVNSTLKIMYNILKEKYFDMVSEG